MKDCTAPLDLPLKSAGQDIYVIDQVNDERASAASFKAWRLQMVFSQ